MLSITCSNISISASIPFGEPNFIFNDLIDFPFIIIGILSLITLGGLIPKVTELGTEGLGNPNRLYKGIPASLAFKSQRAVSIAT